MISELAKEMYAKSILLKKYDERALLFKRNRKALLKELCELKEMTDILISTMNDSSNYSKEYVELALFMKNTLLECVDFLNLKSKNYRTTIRKRIWGFHNLPKAFFSAVGNTKISPATAMEYFKPYLK